MIERIVITISLSNNDERNLKINQVPNPCTDFIEISAELEYERQLAHYYLLEKEFNRTIKKSEPEELTKLRK